MPDLPAPNDPVQELTPYDIVNLARVHMALPAARLKKAGLDELLTTEEGWTEAFMWAKENLPGAAREAASIRAYLFWLKYMEVYVTHPRMSESLMRLKADVKIPAEIFRRLRHPNPFIVTGNGIPVTHEDGFPGRILGFWVVGALTMDYKFTTSVTMRLVGEDGERQYTGAAVPVDTHHEHVNALRVTVLSEVFSMDGTRSTSTDLCHLTVPLTEEFTLAELVDRVSGSGFLWAVNQEESEERKRGYLSTLATAVVSHLLYASSRTVEISGPRPHAAPYEKQNSWDRKPRPTKVHRVGFKTGSVIEDHVRRAQEGHRESVPTGKTVAPHIRAPHSHLYWVGPGRKEIEIKVLDAIPVNMDKYDGKTVTMHPMGR